MTTQPTSASHPSSCTCREHAAPPEITVRAARDAYLAENGFTIEAYSSPSTKGSLFGIPFSVPNPPAHQRGIRLHDLLHAATGYGTDHTGEGEISAWQARRGLGGAGLYVAGIVTFNALLGLIVSPRRTWTAFRAARGEGSIFRDELPYDALLDLTVGELRARLGIPVDGVSGEPRELHAHAPTMRASESEVRAADARSAR